MKMELTVNGKKSQLDRIYTITDMRDKYMIVFKDMDKKNLFLSKEDKIEFDLHL